VVVLFRTKEKKKRVGLDALVMRWRNDYWNPVPICM
jgi:hypothetical protein